MKNSRGLVAGGAPGSVMLVRLMVGGVFFFEGVLKFMLPDELGAGRFAKIGIPAHQAMGPFVGIVDVICGALVAIGLLSRLASIP